MTYLEHLIENCLCNIERGMSYDKIMKQIKKDVNLEYAGITAEQCWEICQYVYYVFIQYGYKKQEKQYAVFMEWGYDKNKKQYYENCIISPATDEDLKHDGENYVSRGGREGMELFICEGLENTIRTAARQWNVKSIQFKDLNRNEKKIKDDVVKEIVAEQKRMLSK